MRDSANPEIVEAILVWSAVPGASRHHWGSEIDVYDAASDAGRLPRQAASRGVFRGGVFERLADWLNDNLERFDFFRPYDEDRGGVYPEPWHISYAPVAAPAQSALTADVIASALHDSDVLGKDIVLAQLPDIYQRYVANIGSPSSRLV